MKQEKKTNTYEKEFSKRLKLARRSKKISQEAVALEIKTSRSNISKYENGELQPNIKTIKLLCELYQISADELFDIDIKREE